MTVAKKPPKYRSPKTKPLGYDRHRSQMAERTQAESRAGRDIGEISKPANLRRPKRCQKSLRTWCETDHAETFDLAWSPDHLRVIETMQSAIIDGGQFALTMPRGSGKTSLCETACLFALLTGQRRYVALIGVENTHALEMLESMYTELETNDLLLANFPEVCYPLVCLEGIPQRRLLDHAEQIRLRMRGDKIILPYIEGSQAAGAVLHIAGITGRIRGMKHKLSGGEAIRPDLTIVDDPQTDDSDA